jgi:methylated-DNA-[protein]-cysteine S-methyltransferase
MKMKIENKTANAKRKDLSCLTMNSAVGELLLVADETALTGVYFAGRDHIPANHKHWKTDGKHPVLRQAAIQLKEYFDLKRMEFDLPLRPSGTGFQERVWREIARIPFGKTLTYSELAERAGSPDAVRAAGASTGANPLSIIVPCHRVVGKSGKLTGFAGGLERKEHLLRLEGAGR